MKLPRRIFLAQSLLMLAAFRVRAAPKAQTTMPHIVLLGDSIFDNGRYTNGGPDVIAQVRKDLPPSWKATLLAVDGATTHGIGAQLKRLPADTSHLVLSIGGNDALGSQHILQAAVRTTAEGLMLLAKAAEQFEDDYRNAIAACRKQALPLIICTIYNGSFPDRDYQRQVTTALAAFNDAIIRTGSEHALPILDLRQICSKPEDYANPIEPSSIGGAKIAHAIVHTITEPAQRRGAYVIGAVR